MTTQAVPVEAVPVETVSVEAVAAVPFPQWCYCAYQGQLNEGYTSQACTYAGGHYDGHTCECDNDTMYNNFGNFCNSN
ncbi:hypothetical protein BGZ99_007669, partial [Dissophora globulifera]